MASEEGRIRLVIKNAALARDFPIDLASTASVGDLKAELQRAYPGQPRIAQQKLIFAGRLLTDDTQSLAQHITNSKYDVNSPLAVHLVLPPPSLHSSASGIPSSSTTNRQPDIRRSAPVGLTAQYPPQGQPPMPPQHGQPHPRFVPGNGAAPPPFARPQQVHFAPPPAAAPAPEQRQGPGLLGRQNWWLLAKVIFFIYILAQGGTSWRLAFLTLGGFLLYLYQVGLFPRLNRPAAPQPAPPQAQAAAPEQAERAASEGASPPPVQAQPAAPRMGLWQEMENLFLPLVYSLMPTWQPAAVAQPVPLPGGQPPQVHNHPHQE